MSLKCDYDEEENRKDVDVEEIKICKHSTKPSRTSYSRTRDFFSRGSRLKT